jgi:hypothetical protein
MPIKVKETNLFANGQLVASTTDIYSAPGIDGDEGRRIAGGTVGLILSGPRPDMGFPSHYQVQFMENVVWWVMAGEIEPHLPGMREYP